MTLNWWIISPLGALQLFIAVGGVIVENDAPVIIPCAIGQGNYPSWKGPPMVNDGSTLYNYEQSPMFNPYLSEDKLLRMTWADNKIDLSFSAAIRTDEGNYSCSAARQGTSTVELYVRVPPSPPHIYNTITGSQNELTVSGTEGAPLTLTCISAGGYPQQTVNWYRESVTSTPLRAGPPVVVSGDLYNVTRSYTFTPTSSDDGKTYICQSSYSGEPQLIRYTEVKLFLKLHPSTPTVTALGIPNESPSSVNIVRCTSSGFRPKTISLSWTLGRGMNEPVSNPIVEENMTTNTFSVSDTYSRSVGRADNGKLLTCSINHETLSSPKTASVTLIVQFSTLITTITGNPSIVANGVNSVTFTCTTGSSNPASSITWYLDGQVVISGEPVQESDGQFGGKVISQVLNLTPTRDMDGHVIKCRAGNRLPGSSYVEHQVSLDVKYSPVVTIVSRLETETEAGLLQCLVTGKPTATIEWYRTDNGQMFLLKGTGNNSLNYHLRAVSRDDAGSYKCTANNGIGGDNSSTMQLLVLYKPDVTIIAQNATENSTAELHCVPHGVPDSYTYISWEHTWPGSSDVLRILPGSEVLTLSNLRYEHTGIYTCSVNNGVKFSRNPSAGLGQSFFVVKSRPFVTTSNKTILKAAQLGEVKTIELEFVSNSPGTAINVEKITKDRVAKSTQITTTTTPAIISVEVFSKTVQTEGFMSKINIMVMDQDDLGIYEIVIENDVGYEKRAVNLVPKGEPSPPHIISITYVTKSSALITWTRGFHGGFDQTVKVETSRDGTSWTPTLSLPQGTLEDTSPVNTTIDELLPASLYYLRMFSVNAGGESSKTRLFEFTTKEDILTSNHAAVIGGVVGGSLGVVVAVIVIVIILRRKYTLNCSLSKKKDVHSGIIGQGGDNPGYNAAVTYEVVSSRKDTPDYDALQDGKEGNEDPHVYMPLEDSNPKSHAYYEYVNRENPLYKNTTLNNPESPVP